MRNFSEVYNSKLDKINESKRINADKQRLDLLSAIKREYGISSFNTLSESEKNVYTKMIHEMWDSVDGLNEKGLKFVNESEVSLSKESSKQEISKFVKQEFRKNLMAYFEGMTGKRFTGGSNPITPNHVRDEVEKLTGRKFKLDDFKTAFKDALADLVDKSDMF